MNDHNVHRRYRDVSSFFPFASGEKKSMVEAANGSCAHARLVWSLFRYHLVGSRSKLWEDQYILGEGTKGCMYPVALTLGRSYPHNPTGKTFWLSLDLSTLELAPTYANAGVGPITPISSQKTYAEINVFLLTSGLPSGHLPPNPTHTQHATQSL